MTLFTLNQSQMRKEQSSDTMTFKKKLQRCEFKPIERFVNVCLLNIYLVKIYSLLHFHVNDANIEKRIATLETERLRYSGRFHHSGLCLSRLSEYVARRLAYLASDLYRLTKKNIFYISREVNVSRCV